MVAAILLGPTGLAKHPQTDRPSRRPRIDPLSPLQELKRSSIGQFPSRVTNRLHARAPLVRGRSPRDLGWTERLLRSTLPS